MKYPFEFSPARSTSDGESLSLSLALRAGYESTIFEYDDFGKDVANDISDTATFDFRFGSQNDAMAEHAERDGLNVGMGDEMPAIECRFCATAAEKGECRPGAGAEQHVGMFARRLGQLHDVMKQRFLGEDKGEFLLQADNRFRIEERRGIGNRRGLQFEQVHFVIIARIAHFHAKQESVELRFGETVNAFLLDGILRGENEERSRELNRLSVHGDLIFLHRFEQSRLRFCGRTVDFISEEHLAEYWSFSKDKVVLLTIENGRSGHVRREEVGRKLHALKVAAEELGEHFRERRLGDAGHAFEQDVPPRDHGDEESIHRLVGPDDDAGNFSRDIFGNIGCRSGEGTSRIFTG